MVYTTTVTKIILFSRLVVLNSLSMMLKREIVRQRDATKLV